MSKLFWLVALVPLGLQASPGQTDDHGCHHCWEDCEEYGLEYGEYHCHKPQPGEDVGDQVYRRTEIHPIQPDQSTEGPAYIRDP